jgi:hypothetical protein
MLADNVGDVYRPLKGRDNKLIFSIFCSDAQGLSPVLPIANRDETQPTRMERCIT